MSTQISARQKKRRLKGRLSRGWKLFILLVVLLLTLEGSVLWMNHQAADPSSYTLSGSGLEGKRVSFLVSDDQGRVWAATQGELTAISPDQGWTTYLFPKSGTANEILDLAVDDQGRAWVGTGGGLKMLDRDGKWKNYNLAGPGSAGNRVSSVSVDSNGRVWAVAGGALMRRNDDGSWTNFSLSNPGLIGNRVFSIEATRNGRVWVATEKDLISLSPAGTWWSDPLPVAIVNDMVFITFDNLDHAWIGTGDGLKMLVPGEYWKSHFGGHKVYSLAFDDKGNIWAGTGDGLKVMKSEGRWITDIPSGADLAGVEVISVAYDGRGRLWVGTGEGLSVLTNAYGSIVPVFLTLRKMVGYVVGGWIFIFGLLSWRQGYKKDLTPQPYAQPAGATAPWLGPIHPAEAAPGGQAERQQVVVRLLETFRSGDLVQRRQALAELEKMGEVEEF